MSEITHLLNRLTWLRRVVALIAGVVIVALIVIAIVAVRAIDKGADDRDALGDRLEQQEKENADQKAASDLLAQQVRDLGQKPVVEPDDVPPAGQIVTIPGPAGQDGADGKPGPRGTAGEDGDNGTSGSTGTSGQPGPAGPPGETGPAGQDGKNGTDGQNGADGAPGRGIADAQCGEDGRWVLTWTDGTTSDAGQCRTELLPPIGDPQ